MSALNTAGKAGLGCLGVLVAVLGIALVGYVAGQRESPGDRAARRAARERIAQAEKDRAATLAPGPGAQATAPGSQPPPPPPTPSPAPPPGVLVEEVRFHGPTGDGEIRVEFRRERDREKVQLEIAGIVGDGELGPRPQGPGESLMGTCVWSGLRGDADGVPGSKIAARVRHFATKTDKIAAASIRDARARCLRTSGRWSDGSRSP